jgi:signal transduction histidine kinase
MAWSDRMRRAAKGARLPRRTVRLRLTLLYGALFLLSGAALLAMTYFFVDAATGNSFIVQGKNGVTIAGYQVGTAPTKSALGKPATISGSAATRVPAGTGGTGSGAPGGSRAGHGLTTKQIQGRARQFQDLALATHSRELHQLVVESGLALAIMAVVAIALGWVVAGRVLRPLRVITAATRDISASNLHKRLDLDGPDDELKELGDTIDGLLQRLEASFRSQRQFVANTSHELRTPLARQRTLAQVALSDPDANADSLRVAHERVLASGQQQEQLIDALLTLSRVQAGAISHEAVDLTPLVRNALVARTAEAESRGVLVIPTLAEAPLQGDPRLVERLVANVLDNALRHNVPGGMVVVRTGTRAGHGWFAVSNDGPVVEADQIERLYEPFERLGAERTNSGEGFGLGLCIVQAVATAHGASLMTEARPAGGLSVEVRFPPPRGPTEQEAGTGSRSSAGTSGHRRRPSRAESRTGVESVGAAR